MKKEKSTLAGVGAALLAVLGSVTCCGAPILAGVLASVGIGASQLSFLHSIQPYLIAVALISLAMGFYRLYFKKSNSCCGTDSKAAAPNKRKSKAFLWIVSVITVGMLIYTSNLNKESDQGNLNSEVIKESCCSKPQIKTSYCPSNTTETTADESAKSVKVLTDKNQSSCCIQKNKIDTVTYKVDGLSKTCCIKPFVKKLREDSRIENFIIKKDKDLTVIIFNKENINIDEINTLLTSTGYKAKQVQ